MPINDPFGYGGPTDPLGAALTQDPVAGGGGFGLGDFLKGVIGNRLGRRLGVNPFTFGEQRHQAQLAQQDQEFLTQQAIREAEADRILDNALAGVDFSAPIEDIMASVGALEKSAGKHSPAVDPGQLGTGKGVMAALTAERKGRERRGGLMDALRRKQLSAREGGADVAGRTLPTPEGEIFIPDEDRKFPGPVDPDFDEDAFELISRYPDAAWALNENKTDFSEAGKQVLQKAKSLKRKKRGVGTIEAVSAVFHDTETGGEFAVKKPGVTKEEETAERTADETIEGLSEVAEAIRSGQTQATPEEMARAIAADDPTLSEEEVLAALTELLETGG